MREAEAIALVGRKVRLLEGLRSEFGHDYVPVGTIGVVLDYSVASVGSVRWLTMNWENGSNYGLPVHSCLIVDGRFKHFEVVEEEQLIGSEAELKTYTVIVPYKGQRQYVVDARTIEEAKEKARNCYEERDHGSELWFPRRENLDEDAYKFIDPVLVPPEDWEL
jgi:hypothetical protein